jgi:phospholipid transport system substrate-binding protein
MIKNTGIFIIAGLLIFPFPASAETPLNMVQVNINKILDILHEPAIETETEQSTKRERIRRVTDIIFNYNELSKRTLGQNWKKFSESQRNEFIALYKIILENAYINKILNYTDEKVSFTKEKMLKGKKAEVSTNILTKTAEIPINYRLIFRNEKWGIYDIIIEGVSLISNYRSQFREILMSKSPDEFLDILRKKTGSVQ